MLVAEEYFGGLEGRRAAGENSGVLDQGAVGCAVAGYEDGGSGPDVEGDDGAVLVAEAAEGGLQVGEVLGGLEEP